MNPALEDSSEVEKQTAAAAPMREARPMLWSVRREMWENRSIVIAPVVVASMVLLGFLVSTVGLPSRRRAILTLAAPQQRAAIESGYDMAAFMLLLTAFIVAVFYCLDALHGERRDRSILFWKSMPVSDRTTVLSKLAVPMVILPLFAGAIIVIEQLIMLLVTAAVLKANGLSISVPWAPPMFHLWLALLYALVISTLWYAPIYGWLLLISSWAKRATFLWALVPPFAISLFEHIAFDTHYFARMIGYRLTGWFTEGVLPTKHGTAPLDPLTSLTPGRLLLASGLWIGLIFAAVFITAAARVRRANNPI